MIYNNSRVFEANEASVGVHYEQHWFMRLRFSKLPGVQYYPPLADHIF